MGRVVFKEGKQKDFLERVHKEGNLGWSNIADICNVCERTIRDWRREKFYMNHDAARTLSRRTAVVLHRPKKLLPDYWNMKKIASMGAKRRYEIYGNPGTPEGRRKGGINSQKKFRKNPTYAKNLGITMRKIIKKPKNSLVLAEFIGILLGDGGITNYHTSISFNRETDKQHSVYIQGLIKKLFNISSSIIPYDKYGKADKIVVYSKNLAEFLSNKGLKVGNKIYNRIDIPNWIKNKKEYKIACLRGLIDTDGSFYSYKHKVNGKVYNNFAMCFTSYSTYLLKSVYDICLELNFKPSLGSNQVYLHRTKNIDEYFKIVGSNNIKHIRKYKSYESES